MCTLPESGANSPVIKEMAVVFPAPLGPKRPTISPDSRDRLKSESAGAREPGYVLVSPSARSIINLHYHFAISLNNRYNKDSVIVENPKSRCFSASALPDFTILTDIAPMHLTVNT